MFPVNIFLDVLKTTLVDRLKYRVELMKSFLARAHALLAACLLVAANGPAWSQTSTLQLIPGNISTFYGTGTAGTSPTEVSTPRGVFIDPLGNLFIANTGTSQILKVTPAGVAKVYAGTGAGSYSGDGGLATAAAMHGPEDIAMDAAGNLYIADSTNNRIRMVTPAGIISTVAGSSTTAGYGGDGGPATSALLNTPWGVALDAAGNLYIADEINDCIRVVNKTTQIITTFAGICTSSGFTGDGGAPTAAKLNAPKGIYFDANANAYITDTGNNRIREIKANSNIINTIIGNGGTNFNGDGLAATATAVDQPSGIAFDAAGTLYFNDVTNRLRRMVNGIVTTIAGTGITGYNGDGIPATSANIGVGPKVAIDANGNLYVGDSSQRIREILAAQSSMAFGNQGQGTTSTAQIVALFNFGASPVTLTSIASTTGFVVQQASSGTNCAAGGAIASGQSCVIAVAFAPSALGAASGTLTVTDNGTTQTVLLSGTGTLAPVTTSVSLTPNPVNLGGNTTATIQVVQPASISTIPTGTVTLATGTTSLGSATLAGGKATLTFGSALVPGTYPVVATYSGDTNFQPGTSPAVALVVNGLATATALAVTPTTPQVLQSETLAATVTHATGSSAPTGTITFSDGGTVVGTAPLGANGGATLSPTLAYGPHSITANYSGDALYNPSSSSAASVTVGPGPVATLTPGLLATFAGTSGTGAGGFSGDGGLATAALLNGPYDVATDFHNNVYIADCNNNRVRKVSAGVITTIAGSGSAGYTGDGGQATKAAFHCPRGLATDSLGNVFVYDYFNAAVREITPAGIVTTVAGNGVVGYTGDGGPATSAELSEGWGVAVDPNENLYIADSGNNVIRKVTSSGIITTIAGNGTAGSTGDGGQSTSATLNGPTKVALDAAGNLYIADTGGNRIRLLTPAGVISTFAGTGAASDSGNGGLATSASVDGPHALAIDAAGDVFIGDRLSSVVRMVNPAGIIQTVAGNGTAGYTGNGGSAMAGEIIAPYGIALDYTGNLYIADTSSIGPEHVIREVIANASVINFGTLIVGSAQPNPLLGKLTNTGASNLVLTNLVLTGAGFTLESGTPNGCTPTTVLAPGASCVYAVGFTYTTPGISTGTLVLTDNAGNVANSTQTVTLAATTVLPTPAITLAISPAIFAPPGATVIMMATLTAPIINPNVPNPATPTGTVTFNANGTAIGTAPLTNGVATLTISTLPLGTYTVTASYGGSSGYQPATTASQTYTIAYDFSLAVTPASGQVQESGSLTGSVTLTPSMGLTAPITLSCSNVPYGYTCVFGSGTFTSDGSGTPFTTPVVIQYTGPTGMLRITSTISFCGLCLFGLALGRRRGRRFVTLLSAALLAAIGVGMMSACTSSAITSAAQASYPVSVIATAGVVSHTANIDLEVH